MTNPRADKFKSTLFTASFLPALSSSGVSCAAAGSSGSGDVVLRKTVVVEQPAPVRSVVPGGRYSDGVVEPT